MNMNKAIATVGVIAITGLGAAIADEAPHPSVKARHAIMNLYANNLGQLGAMAKGQVDYDAEAASKAANNLALLVQLDQSTLWPQGTDNAAMSGTRALPAIWQDFPGVMKKSMALSDAVAAMQTAAGSDLAALQGAMGNVGGACSACHKAYRQPED